MPTRTLLSLSLAIAALGGALWLLLPEPTDTALAETTLGNLPAPASRPAHDRGGSGLDGALSLAALPPAPIVPLTGSGDCAVSDHVDELVEELGVLRWSATDHDTRRLEVRRLERFVLEAVGCGRIDETRAALLARLQATDDERLAGRLLIALVGVGGDLELPALWEGVALDERADVLLALAWDPLREGHGPPLDGAQLDSFVAGGPLLPLPLGRAPDASLRPWLIERLLGRPDGHAVADAAAVVLGVAAGDWREAPDALVQAVLAHPREARVPLFMLMRDPSARSRQAIETLRHRHGGFRGLPDDDLEGHEHFALELAEVEAAVRSDQLPDAATLAAALRERADPPGRLEATSFALARLVDGEFDPAGRALLSDGLCAALRAHPDPDSDWLGLLALVRLHVHERYQPQLSIGYDSEAPVDRQRSDERTAVFLRHLADEQPSQRRLAVMGLFGATDGEAVRDALAAALESERDHGVASWIRLALIRL
jgi:hypothetical protein